MWLFVGNSNGSLRLRWRESKSWSGRLKLDYGSRPENQFERGGIPWV